VVEDGPYGEDNRPDHGHAQAIGGIAASHSSTIA
jgi:hypothetical protein